MLFEDFGLRLKRIRRHHRLTQADISKQLQISRQAYSNYEQGRCLPPPNTLATLSVILNSNLFSFFLEDAIKSQSSKSNIHFVHQKKTLGKKGGETMSTNSFANTLTEKRIAAGYTQAQAADLLYLSRSTYNHYENGTRVPSAEILIEISLLYKTDLIDLLIPLVPAESLEKLPIYTKIVSKESLSIEERQILAYYRALDTNEQVALSNMAWLLNRTHADIS
ncbi:MAG: transcriptional regulator [Lachnospiraceae bacterium]|nr:transcriptional regulator [Lachnospiraceae bacterium]